MRQQTQHEKRIGTRLASVGTAFCLLALVSGCPGVNLTDLFDLVGTPGFSNGTGPSDSSADDLTGRWFVTEIDFSDCDDSLEPRIITWDVVQNGSNVTITAVGSNFALSGTIFGNTLNLQGSFPQDGGTTTVTSGNITVDSTGNSISGSNIWNWSDGFDFCSGSTSLSGSRN